MKDNKAIQETYISPETGKQLTYDREHNVFTTRDRDENFRFIADDIPDFRVRSETMENTEVNRVQSHLEALWKDAESNGGDPHGTLKMFTWTEEQKYRLKTWKAELLAFLKGSLRGHSWTQAESMELYRSLTDVYPNALRKNASMFRDGKLCSLSLMNFKRLSLEPLFRLIREHNIRSVLDFGCGWGANTILLKKEFPDIDVWSFDYSPYRVLSTRFNLKKLNMVPYRLTVADGSRLPFQEDSVDLVFTSHVLEQMNEVLAPALREIHRVSRRFAVHMEPSYHFAGPVYKLRVIRKNYPRDIAVRSRALGWRLQECRPANPTWAPTPAEWIVLEKNVSC